MPPSETTRHPDFRLTDHNSGKETNSLYRPPRQSFSIFVGPQSPTELQEGRTSVLSLEQPSESSLSTVSPRLSPPQPTDNGAYGAQPTGLQHPDVNSSDADNSTMDRTEQAPGGGLSSKRKPCNRKERPGYIARPRNAFIIFRSSIIADKNIPGSMEKCHGNVSKAIGSLWNGLSADEKRHWQHKAELEKEAHRLRYPDYKFAPQRKRGWDKYYDGLSASFIQSTKTAPVSQPNHLLPPDFPFNTHNLIASYGSSFHSSLLPDLQGSDHLYDLKTLARGTHCNQDRLTKEPRATSQLEMDYGFNNSLTSSDAHVPTYGYNDPTPPPFQHQTALPESVKDDHYKTSSENGIRNPYLNEAKGKESSGRNRVGMQALPAESAPRSTISLPQATAPPIGFFARPMQFQWGRRSSSCPLPSSDPSDHTDSKLGDTTPTRSKNGANSNSQLFYPMSGSNALPFLSGDGYNRNLVGIGNTIPLQFAISSHQLLPPATEQVKNARATMPGLQARGTPILSGPSIAPASTAPKSNNLLSELTRSDRLVAASTGNSGLLGPHRRVKSRPHSNASPAPHPILRDHLRTKFPDCLRLLAASSLAGWDSPSYQSSSCGGLSPDSARSASPVMSIRSTSRECGESVEPSFNHQGMYAADSQELSTGISAPVSGNAGLYEAETFLSSNWEPYLDFHLPSPSYGYQSSASVHQGETNGLKMGQTSQHTTSGANNVSFESIQAQAISFPTVSPNQFDFFQAAATSCPSTIYHSNSGSKTLEKGMDTMGIDMHFGNAAPITPTYSRSYELPSILVAGHEDQSVSDGNVNEATNFRLF